MPSLIFTSLSMLLSNANRWRIMCFWPLIWTFLSSASFFFYPPPNWASLPYHFPKMCLFKLNLHLITVQYLSESDMLNQKCLGFPKNFPLSVDMETENKLSLKKRKKKKRTWSLTQKTWQMWYVLGVFPFFLSELILWLHKYYYCYYLRYEWYHCCHHRIKIEK